MWGRLRRSVQVLAALLLLSPLAGLTLFLGTYSASLLFGKLHLADPFAALQTGVAGLAVAALPVVALNVLLGRVFCGWICPLGFLLEGVDRLRKGLGLRERTLPRWTRWTRWPLAAGLLAGSLLAGQPLFEWLSPQANLARLLLFGLAWEALIIPAVALADLLVARRLWCTTLCPAGVTYGLLAQAGTVRVALDRERCHKCGICLNGCPQGRFVLSDAVSGKGAPIAHPDACIACGECIDRCPSRALGFQFGWQADPGRRAALVTLGAATVATALSFGKAALAAPERTVIRPPGALPEPLFKALCLRCGKCAQVCPLGSVGLKAGLPYLNLRDSACDMCRKCPPVCPTGALTLEPEEPIRMGTAVVDTALCWAWNGQVCRSCFVACPLQGTALRLEREGAIQRPLTDPAVCTGCGLCEHACPVDPSAIYVTPVD